VLSVERHNCFDDTRVTPSYRQSKALRFELNAMSLLHAQTPRRDSEALFGVIAPARQ
jgi:hypothetical protein